MAYIDTCLQYYLHIPDPSLLEDEAWALKWAQLQDIRIRETGKKGKK